MKKIVAGLLMAVLLAAPLPLLAQFVNYAGRNTTHVFKSIILSGTTRGEVTGPEITRVSSTSIGIPGVVITNGDFGSSGVAGSVDIFPATAARGKLSFVAANSAGDTTTTITNASQAGAVTYTIPDAGASASFVLTEGAATINGAKRFDNNGLTIEDSDNTHVVTISPGNESASRVLSIPVLGGADTVVTLATAQTLAGVKTFGNAALKIQDSDATHGVTITPGNETADRVLSVPVLGGADILMTTGTTQSVTGTKVFTVGPHTTVGIGAAAGAGVVAVEHGSNAIHKTVLALTSVSVDVTDTGGAAGAQGNLVIYDFPAGVIVRGGCTANATTLAGAGGIADGAAVVLALGTVAAGVGDATLSSTEADFIASFAGTLTAGAGIFAKYGEPSVTSLDGHTTAVDLFLNVAVPDADVSATDTLAVTGTITCVWTNTGDF